MSINALAERCTLCGAQQPVRRRALATLMRYLPASLGVLLAAGLVTFAVAMSGSSPAADPSHRLFEVRRDATLVTLVPQNWQGGRVTSAPHVTRETFVDPDRTRYAMTIEMRRHAAGSALNRARLAFARIGKRPGFVPRAFLRVTFPGGRGAWLIEYEAASLPHALYLFSACAPAASISVDLSAPTRAELSGPLSQLPVATGPRC
ncbi:MAG: hypothetical protein ACR2ND_10210 [Solirubrobacteraceae bacterium]